MATDWPVFYVYELIDPRDGSVFYVGKGKDRRAWAHEAHVMRKGCDHSAKEQRIAAILGDGLRVQHHIVQHFDDERAALDMEADLIDRHGIENLTNKARRGALSAGSLKRTIEIAWRIIHTAAADIRHVGATIDGAVGAERERLRELFRMSCQAAVTAFDILRMAGAHADPETGGVLPRIHQVR